MDGFCHVRLPALNIDPADEVRQIKSMDNLPYD